uniref:Trefoil factor 1 n=1 Tax=Aotus nancymaae TaxID=37293 RepID=A0A2K5EA00_AOTNA
TAPMEHKVICALVLVSVLALSTLVETQSETCAMAPRERKNCGFPGVTAAQCTSKGCCFDDTVPGFPWCFTPKTIDVPSEDECEF